MSRQDARRRRHSLIQREQHICDRFIAPLGPFAGWTAESRDRVAAYVGLVHAEAEAALEDGVRMLLNHAFAGTQHGYAHPVLLNALLYYQSELESRVGVRLVSKRTVLSKAPSTMSAEWEQSGAKQYWDARVARNHGAGRRYLESLLEPLGLRLTMSTFSKVQGAGVAMVAAVPPAIATELAEFVELRGRAMHTGASSFEDRIRLLNPTAIRTSGARATAAIGKVVDLLADRAW